MRSLLLLSLTACVASSHPTEAAALPAQRAAPTADLQTPGPWTHTAVLSARWSVPLSGLLDLTDPRASFDDAPTNIVLPVHVLQHPTHGTFVIDSGVPRSMMTGPGPLEGTVLASFLTDLTPEQPLGAIAETYGLDGVLITHLHLDHVLGLPDVPPTVPVYVGPGEQDARKFENLFLRTVMSRVLADRDPLKVWPFETAGVVLGPVPRALDVFGDGTLWALHVPGHTAGSTAFLARTSEGPKLFTGDCSHTLWGWEHGVTPGTYTADHDTNQVSLDALKALAAEVGAEVFVGHELDGVGTGVE